MRASTSLMGLNFSAFVLYWLALLGLQHPTNPAPKSSEIITHRLALLGSCRTRTRGPLAVNSVSSHLLL